MTLKGLRKQKNLTQEQLAELLGVSRITIVRLEAGSAKMTLRVLERIMEEFGLTYEETKTLCEHVAEEG